MDAQNYKNHVRYYFPHHFIFYPIVIGAAGVSMYFIFSPPIAVFVWIALAGQFLLLAWLSFMLRQHYALNTQNRIVRLELRLRYFILTGKRLEEIESKLTLPQLLAVRFASDEEFVRLVHTTIESDLSPDEIKKSVVNWLPDYMRV